MSKVFMLIGVPASGKSTWVQSQNFDLENTVIASSDNHVEEYAKSVGKTYNDVFKEFANKAVTQMMADVEHAISNNLVVVWDQTNTTAESRIKKLKKFPSHYEKIAVVFPVPTYDELDRRLKSRPGKNIPSVVMKNMIANFQVPTANEGFSQIINV